ncbi:MAG: ATP-binding protein [Proteobacteria bacterium]|nr:ATP-binding protein [Pseudomonadota bacterium]
MLRRTLRSGNPQLLATLDRIERSIVRCDRVMEELFYCTRISAIDPRPAVVNVFENAYEALEEGAADPPVYEQLVVLHTGESHHRIEIVIEDKGPGIPADVLPRIFEPLYSTKGFGMGLGLPVARQIMELHGGGIEIEEGCGTRVCLWLPCCEMRESMEAEGNRC